MLYVGADMTVIPYFPHLSTGFCEISQKRVLNVTLALRNGADWQSAVQEVRRGAGRRQPTFIVSANLWRPLVTLAWVPFSWALKMSEV